MTFIQPKKETNQFAKLNVFLIIPIFVGLVLLVILYNQIVSINHEISLSRKKLGNLEAQSAELKEKLFGFLSSNNMSELASSRNLVSEKNPEYFNPQKQWAFVSQ